MIKGGSAVKPALGRPGVANGGMQPFGSDLTDDDIWAIVSWLRNQKGHEAAEAPREEAREHGAGSAPVQHAK
jgi:cytochrome c oxidase cbb3-type subunit 2